MIEATIKLQRKEVGLYEYNNNMCLHVTTLCVCVCMYKSLVGNGIIENIYIF